MKRCRASIVAAIILLIIPTVLPPAHSFITPGPWLDQILKLMMRYGNMGEEENVTKPPVNIPEPQEKQVPEYVGVFPVPYILAVTTIRGVGNVTVPLIFANTSTTIYTRIKNFGDYIAYNVTFSMDPCLFKIKRAKVYLRNISCAVTEHSLKCNLGNIDPKEVIPIDIVIKAPKEEIFEINHFEKMCMYVDYTFMQSAEFGIKFVRHDLLEEMLRNYGSEKVEVELHPTFSSTKGDISIFPEYLHTGKILHVEYGVEDGKVIPILELLPFFTIRLQNEGSGVPIGDVIVVFAFPKDVATLAKERVGGLWIEGYPNSLPDVIKDILESNRKEGYSLVYTRIPASYLGTGAVIGPVLRISYNNSSPLVRRMATATSPITLTFRYYIIYKYRAIVPIDIGVVRGVI